MPIAIAIQAPMESRLPGADAHDEEEGFVAPGAGTHWKSIPPSTLSHSRPAGHVSPTGTHW